MDPRADGIQRQRKLARFHKELGPAKDSSGTHAKIACMVRRTLDDALRVKACPAGRVLESIGTRQNDNSVKPEHGWICLPEDLPSGAVRLIGSD